MRSSPVKFQPTATLDLPSVRTSLTTVHIGGLPFTVVAGECFRCGTPMPVGMEADHLMCDAPEAGGEVLG